MSYSTTYWTSSETFTIKHETINTSNLSLELMNKVSFRIEILDKNNVDEYLTMWKEAQADSPWIVKGSPFTPVMENEFDDLQNALGKIDFQFWVALADEVIIGGLCCARTGDIIRIGITDREPAVIPRYRDGKIGFRLLDAAYSWALNRKAAGVFTRLKLLPWEDPKANWHVQLYYKWGLNLQQSGISLGTTIKHIKRFANQQVEFRTGKDIEFDTILNLVLESFESVKNFEYDPLLHDPTSTKKFHLEFYKESPDNIIVATLDDTPVGFVFVNVPREKSPVCGLIGTLGVIPGYRGLRIGKTLVQKAHDQLLRQGYLYSFVSTSESNKNSLRLYSSAGFKPVYRLFTFVKTARDVLIAKDHLQKSLESLTPLESM
ncbi:MAG: GNAT family N-acetyltransferase [Candidatus Odinarchaeota archaeon]